MEPITPHPLDSMNNLRARRFQVWVMSRIHEVAYRASKGLIGGRIKGPVLLLTTVGRKTGRSRTTPLLYLTKQPGWAVIASYGGAPRHPQWWLNLKANSSAAVLIKSAKIAVRAREALGEERDQLWLEFVSMYPGYVGYEQRTDRRFPIAVLEPFDGEVH